MSLDRFAKVVTPLGESLLLHSMTGREELSRPFSYDLVLLSTDATIKASALLGQGISVELDLPDGQVRYWDGIVSRFARGAGQGRYAMYGVTMRPWVWLLSRTADCRIFQNMTAPDVIKQVFRDFGLTDFDDALNDSYRSWDYLVQYRETALAFVSRLMEHEGIYYYFKHESGKHVLVLSDSYSAHGAAPGYEEVPYFPPEPNSLRERDHLAEWSMSQQIQPGAYMLNDFDFMRPKASLQAKAADPRDHARGEMEYYDYPGEYVETSDGENYAKSRLQALLAQHEQAEGRGNARGLCAGNLFKLTQFPVEDQNQEYLIVSTSYFVQNSTRESGPEADVLVSADITAIESSVQFRASQLTPKPTISGPQTAIVVGKAGEEIWTDQYGRVKVQFHWDRLGSSNENSSCWVRVAQLWAGGRWGAMHIPRIGQEVIVEFLEGDPDRPIITGRVYNGDNKPPYVLPGNQTQSGIKSRSSKSGNPDNCNELRFEDKMGDEHVYLQAEKDLQIYVKHDETRKIDNDRFKEVIKNEATKIGVDRSEEVGSNETILIGANQTITVMGSRTEKVVQDESVNVVMARSHTIGADDTLAVAGALTETVVGRHDLQIGGDRTHTVAGDESVSIGGGRDLTVARDHNIDIIGSQSTSILKNETLKVIGKRAVKVSKDESIDIGAARTQQVAKNDSLDVGKKLSIVAGDEIVLRAGESSITLKKNGEITLSGKNINLKGGGKITIKASGDVVIKGTKVNQD